jgi:hypothetical protein
MFRFTQINPEKFASNLEYAMDEQKYNQGLEQISKENSQSYYQFTTNKDSRIMQKSI